MNDGFPTEWKFLTRTYDSEDRIDKAYYERIVKVDGDMATLEVGWYEVQLVGDVYRTVGDIHIERRYDKRIGGLVKTLPLTPEIRKECARQSGRSTYQFGYGAHASGTYADKCKKKNGRKYSW